MESAGGRCFSRDEITASPQFLPDKDAGGPIAPIPISYTVPFATHDTATHRPVGALSGILREILLGFQPHGGRSFQQACPQEEVDAPRGRDEHEEDIQEAVDGRLDGRLVRAAWVGHAAEAGTLQIDFETFEAPYRQGHSRWYGTFPLQDVKDVRVAVGPNAVLAAAEISERKESYTRSALSIYLLDQSGNPIAVTNLMERNVTWSGPGDFANGTVLYIDGLHAVDGSFWVLGHSWTAMGGTTVLRAWAVHIDAETGATAEWEVHRLEAPTPSSPTQPGDREILPFQSSIAGSARVFLASSLYSQTMNVSGLWEPNPGEGGLYLTSLLTGGEVEYTTRLDDANIGQAPLFPFIAPREGGVMVFAFPLASLERGVAYSLAQPSMAVTSREIPLDIGQQAMFSGLGGSGHDDSLSLGSGVADFVGEVYVEDAGLLGWRRQTVNPSLAFVHVPAILRIDLEEGTAQTIPLTSPRPPPDILLEVLTTTVFAVTGVLSLLIAYPRWRLHRERAAA